MLDSGALISLVHHFSQTAQSYPNVSLIFLWNSWSVKDSGNPSSPCCGPLSGESPVAGKCVPNATWFVESHYIHLFSRCVDKLFDKGHLSWEELVYFDWQFKGIVLHVSQQQQLQTAHHTQEAEREWCRCSAHLTCFIQPGPQTHRRTEPHSRVASPPQLAQVRSSPP